MGGEARIEHTTVKWSVVRSVSEFQTAAETAAGIARQATAHEDATGGDHSSGRGKLAGWPTNWMAGS